MLILMRVLLFLLFILAIAWPIHAYRKWPAPWRFGALVALLFPVAFISHVVYNLLVVPVYNLSEVELLVAVFGSLAVMVITIGWWRRRVKPDL